MYINYDIDCIQCHHVLPLWANMIQFPAIARQLRLLLQEAGINTDTFQAHSVISAVSSLATWSGVTTLDILNAADLSTETTVQHSTTGKHRPGPHLGQLSSSQFNHLCTFMLIATVVHT